MHDISESRYRAFYEDIAMADEADIAASQDEVYSRAATAHFAALVSKQESKPQTAYGTCLFCHEECDHDKQLHDYCVEDYQLEQKMKAISGRRH
jgi:hypothetical protein